jgi:TctA family transporter
MAAMSNTVLVVIVLVLTCIAAWLLGIPRQILFAGIVIAITIGAYVRIRIDGKK